MRSSAATFLLCSISIAASCERPSAPPTTPSTAAAEDPAPVADEPQRIILRSGAAPRPCAADQAACRDADPLPPCHDRPGVTPWDRLKQRRDALVGTTIVLEGRLVRGAADCTLLGCIDGGCCNRCTAHPELAGDLGRLEVHAAFPSIQCKGDESQVCCTHALDGNAVRVRGILESSAVAPGAPWDEGLRLEDARVCRLAFP